MADVAGDSEIGYEPDIDSWVEQAKVGLGSALLISVDPGENVPAGVEVRIAKVKAALIGLPAGVFSFGLEDGTKAVLAIGGGREPATAGRERLDRIEDDHDLAQAASVFNAMWAGAQPTGRRPAFASGDLVQVAGSDQVGEVVRTEWDGEGHIYTVRIGTELKRLTDSGLQKFQTELDDPIDWIGATPASAEQVALLLTHTKLSHPLSDTIYSYGSSKTVYRAYQFKPVLRLMASPRKRLLIADEVGLGKTIEAGLVWTELEHRSSITRAIVVCPAMLVTKWRDEMRRRFDRDLRVLDGQTIEDLVQLFRRGDDTTPMYGVVSLERIRSAAVLEALQAANPSFDLAIVDEAHYLRNPATLSHEVGELLSDWSDALVFLSATPLNLGQADLFTLLNLLVPEEFNDQHVLEEQLAPNAILTEVARHLRLGDRSPRELMTRLAQIAGTDFGITTLLRPEARELLGMLATDEPLSPRDLATARRLLGGLHPLASVVTRTRKVDVPEDKAVRQAEAIEVEWKKEEYDFYNAVHEWTLADLRSRGVPTGFGTQMPLRQAASCLPAMAARLRASPWGHAEAETRTRIDSDSDGWDDVIDLEGVDPRTVWNHHDIDALRARVGRLAKGVEHVDTKFDALGRKLEELRSAGIYQVMIFSFFHATLEYLNSRLSAQARVGMMHGGVDFDERKRIMQRFRDGDIDVLLLSEVGSEGLDFEFCSVVVNYDLPWNPMKVEQRIGRVDRFGQQADKIFVLNFHVPGTIETDILQRLYDRLGVFERSIGELEPVLRSELGDLGKTVLDPELSPEERDLRLREKASAIEERARQLRDIEDASSQLAGIDNLLIDGLERERDRGRYVGAAELRRYLESSFRDGTHARFVGADADLRLVGDALLQKRLLKHVRAGAGTRFGLSELGRLLGDEEPVPITFDHEVASTTDRELISARHPLVQAATRHYGETGAPAVGRFGAVRVPAGDGAGIAPGVYAVVVHLLEATGLRPSLELWPVAVDLEHHDEVDGVGDALLAALARGTLRDDRKNLRAGLEAAVAAAQHKASIAQRREEMARQESNEALVEARIAAVRSEIDHKIARARRALSKVSDDRIQRLHRGRIRNLEADQERRADEMERRRAISVSVAPVAVVQVRIT